ncbi:MAG: Hsp20 family protein [Bacteriovoracaceae bacterium]|nr:Hsp20 family protein [Bacteriovoracaceae bacterium]
MNVRTMFVIFLLIPLSVMSQSPKPTPTVTPDKSRDEINERFRKSLMDKFKNDRKVIEKMLGGGLFKQFDKKLEDMLKQFDNGLYQQFEKDMNKFFDDENFDQIFKNANPYQFMNAGEFKWIETPKERILILKSEFPKDAPLDIKIENGKVHLKGKVMKQGTWMDNGQVISGKRAVDFDRKISIPRDVHFDKASFDKKDGNIIIKFPKKYIQKAPLKKKKKSSGKKLKPLKRQEGERKI